jgi:hypothetical protein
MAEEHLATLCLEVQTEEKRELTSNWENFCLLSIITQVRLSHAFFGAPALPCVEIRFLVYFPPVSGYTYV